MSKYFKDKQKSGSLQGECNLWSLKNSTSAYLFQIAQVKYQQCLTVSPGNRNRITNSVLKNYYVTNSLR